MLFRLLRSQNDNDLENEEKIDSNHRNSKEEEISKDNNSESDIVKENASEEKNEFELLKKLQALQNMNPAIKALMNYKGNIR